MKIVQEIVTVNYLSVIIQGQIQSLEREGALC